ncbi:hypothetical protein ACFL07_01785 [Pseudomonadota bacterium]
MEKGAYVREKASCAQVQIPAYFAQGEIVRVNTETGYYISPV